jgi:hypothetical protein
MAAKGEHATSTDTKVSFVSWVLRVGVAGCFIGHGAFGIITKAAWVRYFAGGGVSEPLAWQLMPQVGAMDIAVGVLALLWPCRALFIWAAIWATWTALLRPFAGEPIWEFLERAGNYGVPFALLAIVGGGGVLFSRLPDLWPTLTDSKQKLLAWILRTTTATLLVGHAGLGLFAHKPGLALHYASLGVSDSAACVSAIGAFEFLLAASVMFRPRPSLLVGICLWKILTESLFILSGAPGWEVIERFGSYTAPLALAILLTKSQPKLRLPFTDPKSFKTILNSHD